MTTQTPNTPYSDLVPVQAATTLLDTSTMFRGNPPQDNTSPYDQYMTNTEAINRIYLSQAVDGEQLRDKLDPELSALVVLGYMSAVESYMRALVRRLIEVDEMVHGLVEPMNVSFGAARHHTRELLPEAITEHISFAGSKGFKGLILDFLGVKGNLPEDIVKTQNEFLKICEIRHCCVHRFGRLGSKTAIALGTSTHKSLLEMPFHPTLLELQRISAGLNNFVQILNNFIFKSVVERIPRHERDVPKSVYSWSWRGNWQQDRKKFTEYYLIFASRSQTGATPAPHIVYRSFKTSIILQPTGKKATKIKEVA